VLNFVRTHCLIGDHIDGNMIHFINQHVSSISVDTITVSNMNSGKSHPSTDANEADEVKLNVYYLGTGK
jgi:hypothetical protein